MSEVMDRARMEALTRDLPTKAAKIRKLAAAGVTRADIARFLEIRYQHVRNVLVTPEPLSSRSGAPPKSGSGEMRSSMKLKLGADGEIVIPAAFRDRLGLKPGQTLFAVLENGEIHILPVSAAIRRAQAVVRRFVPEGVSLVDELLEDRRREVVREASNG
jgi:AbrB family looped-hinge helix DNA binding protein